MRAVPVRDLLEPRTRGTPHYEIKFDGWRCVAFPGYLQSRHGRDLTPYFPDVTAHLDAALLPDTVLDGELIIFDPATGRTSFPALQTRVASRRPTGLPASYVVFDLLQLDRHELLDRPLLERRMLLEDLLTGVPGLTVCPATRDPAEARGWFEEYAPTGAEGLIIKDLTSRYRPKGPGWWKWKRRSSAEAVVAGYQGTALLLGRYAADGRLRIVGRTSPLPRPAWADLAALLTPVGERTGWPGPFGRETAEYQPVEPTVVVEVAADEAFEQGRWRHTVRFLRPRPDVQPSELPLWRPDAQSWVTR